MNDTSLPPLIYEQAVNERMRTFLRIDFLARQFEYHYDQPSLWGTRATVATLLEFVSLISRHNIKVELIRELDQRLAWLDMLSSSDNADLDLLKEVVELHQNLREDAHNLQYPVHQHLTRHDMLNMVSQRIRMPGCTSETDIPLYHNWLTSRQADHASQLKQWYEPFAPIIQIARTVLEMVRDSAEFVPETAREGWFEQELDPARIHQMIRIRMPAESGFYPEISIGKRSFSIVFREGIDLDQRPIQTAQEVKFELACCLF